jgi:ATP-dependent helicase/nuclease subunit B
VRAPAPRPPAQARLRQLGATDVERLIRDPYALYARRILGLRARRPVGGGLDAAERGQLIHGVLENASRRAARADVPEPDDLLEEIVAALRACGVEGAALAAERVRLVRPAAEFARWLGVRREAVARTFLETPGALALPDEFVLVARADRIDLWADGTAEILDIKTGRIATTPQAASGLAPQLPLEAAILAAGGFEGVGRAEPSGLVYWRFAASEHGPSPLKLDIASACSDATGGLMRLLRAFCAPDAPFRSKPRPQFLADYPEYDHLARRKEWADIEEEGE